MAFTSGCNHPSFTLPWRTLLPYLVALHLLQPGSAQLTVVAPSIRVSAIVGQDVVLRCQLSPCKDARNSDIRWIQQRSAGFVHHYQYGVDLDQMEEYKGRTELLRDGLSDGNLDLRITAVSTSDRGSYSCAVQDGDGYGDAVVELEVSDPFSQIVHPWKVALAVVITILVGSFVIIVFLYRKKAAQSRELKRNNAELVDQAVALVRNDAELERKDAELAKQAALSMQRDAMLEKHVLKLEKDCEEMGSSVADLKKLAAKLEKHSEEMWTRDVKLERLAAKLEQQTKELEKQHSQFHRHFQNMYFSAVNQKVLGAVLGQQAKESEERHEEMVEQTEAVVVDNEEAEKPSEESD